MRYAGYSLPDAYIPSPLPPLLLSRIPLRPLGPTCCPPLLLLRTAPWPRGTRLLHLRLGCFSGPAARFFTVVATFQVSGLNRWPSHPAVPLLSARPPVLHPALPHGAPSRILHPLLWLSSPGAPSRASCCFGSSLPTVRPLQFLLIFSPPPLGLIPLFLRSSACPYNISAPNLQISWLLFTPPSQRPRPPGFSPRAFRAAFFSAFDTAVLLPRARSCPSHILPSFTLPHPPSQHSPAALLLGCGHFYSLSPRFCHALSVADIPCILLFLKRPLSSPGRLKFQSTL